VLQRDASVGTGTRAASRASREGTPLTGCLRVRALVGPDRERTQDDKPARFRIPMMAAVTLGESEGPAKRKGLGAGGTKPLASPGVRSVRGFPRSDCSRDCNANATAVACNSRVKRLSRSNVSFKKVLGLTEPMACGVPSAAA
jgi:hypothetical protein